METGKYALVNGVNMYFETHGAGKPLVLLHGGFGTIDMFAQILPSLAETRQVIAVEMQGHGHTADIDRPLSYEHMADDIAALMKHLNIENCDILGYSLGGGVALQTAIRHPDVINKIIVLSAPFKRDGWYAEVLDGMASITTEGMSSTILYDIYASIAPNPEDWPNLVNKTRQLLGTHYDWMTPIASLQMPMLIIVGDADSVRFSHAEEMFEVLGGGKADGDMAGLPRSQFAVLPGTTHWGMQSRADLLLPIISRFLNAPVPQENKSGESDSGR
jgi:pimeloyl-ACP methyl ester carboxylesterase